MSDITIIMPSYNKEKYIAEALDSVFMQETTYDYHIIVADDYSTDKTVAIVKQYQQKYPNKITLLESEKNQKLYRNVLRAYEITKTDYFCVLDPDDFWIDKHKIQKALDFLEKNNDYTIYVTDTDILTPEGERKKFIKRTKMMDSDFNDYLKDKAQLGCSLGVTFRNVVFKNGIPTKMQELECASMEESYRGDSFRTAIHLHEGKAHCVPEVDAIYRITDEGVWQGADEVSQNLLTANLNKDLWLYFDKKYPELLLKSYRLINKLSQNKLDAILEIKDFEKVKIIFEKLRALKAFFNEHQVIISKNIYKNVKIKYKILLFIYKKLYKNLSKKGLV